LTPGSTSDSRGRPVDGRLVLDLAEALCDVGFADTFAMLDAAVEDGLRDVALTIDDREAIL
jgi:hypothetical protein